MTTLSHATPTCYTQIRELRRGDSGRENGACRYTHMSGTRYYLEMASLGELRPSPGPAGRFAVRRHAPPDPDLARWLYATVGAQWRWVDRLPWTRDDWARYVARPDIALWVLWDEHHPAGYFELATSSEDGSIEIAYFGLLPDYVGRGLGGYLLTEAVRTAFLRGARRVWLHTCTHDHPHALPNYEARGLRVYRTEPL